MNQHPVVYIVDGEPDHRLLLASTVSEALPEARILETMSGHVACQTIESANLDVILFGDQLADTSGLDFLKAARGQGITTPMVLVTDHGSEEGARQAFLEGVTDYISKDEAFRHPSRFLQKLRHAIEQRRLEEEHRGAKLLLENFLENNPYAILICDSEGAVVRWNRAWTQLLPGEHNLQWLRDSYSPFLDAQLKQAGVIENLRNALHGSWVVIRPFPWDPGLAGFQGPPRILRGVAFASPPEGGPEAHLCMMMQDVTVEETARRERDEYGAILSGLLNASPAAIFFVDLNRQVRFANYCVEEFFGFAPSQIIGCELPDLAAKISQHAATPESLVEAIEMGEQAPPGPADDFIEIRYPNHRFLRRQCRPVTGPNGAPVGRIELYTDETGTVEKQHDLEEENRELDAFASRLAHDLKTPLVSLKGFADLLDRQYASQIDERGLLYLEKVRASAAILGEMVDGLRDLAHAGQPSGNHVVPDPLVVLRLVCENLAPLSQEHQVAIRLPKTVPAVCCDRAKLFQILQNLISNAIRYCDANCTERFVAVEAIGNGKEVIVRVADNGIGMPYDHLEHIFEPFWRGHTSRGGGMGLGLAITQRLVKAAKGRISVESEPGRGTTFTIIFPQAPAETGTIETTES